MSFAIFQINGGIGKCIAATAVVKAIKKKYPDHKLIVISGYPEVFINNSSVFRASTHGQTQYFFRDYVEDLNSKIFILDPYNTEDFIYKRKHLIQIWCELYGLPYNGEQPEVILTEREKNFYKNSLQFNKPVMVIQPNGGAEQQQLKYSWARDLPKNVVEEVIKHFSADYDIVHLKRQDQMGYAGTIPYSGTFRELVTLLSISEKRLFIDSFAQHLAASCKLKSTVAWIANSPKVFGYEIHDNIEANAFTHTPELVNSYLAKFDITGNPIEFPYNSEEEIFDTEKIIQSLKA